MSTLNVSRGAVEGCCYFRPLRRCQIHGCTARPFRRKQGARAPRCTVALTGAAQVLSQFLPRNEVRPAACPPFLPNPPCCALPTQSSCRRHGGHVRNRCSLYSLSHSHPISGAACGRVGTVLAQDWRSARRSFTPCALRMHRKAGTTSHGWEPARGFDDLPHWQGAICFPNDQCRSLPRGATFEAIPGEWRRILVPDGDCAAACSGGKRTMPVFFSGATLPTLLGADRRVVCGCT